MKSSYRGFVWLLLLALCFTVMEAADETWGGCEDPVNGQKLVTVGKKTTICLSISDGTNWTETRNYMRLNFQPLADEYSRFVVPKCRSSPLYFFTLVFYVFCVVLPSKYSCASIGSHLGFFCQCRQRSMKWLWIRGACLKVFLERRLQSMRPRKCRKSVLLKKNLPGTCKSIGTFVP